MTSDATGTTSPSTSDVAPTTPKTTARTTLWSRSFLLLWQGQLVSSLGDVVYEIALGFWILAATGSTVLMGSLMAATALPRIIVAPFAGVVVDRSDRRRLLILMDAVRGAAVVLVGIAALAGVLQVWMMFVAGIVIGLGGAFFGPAVGSALPDIIPKEKLLQGNSAFQLLQTGSGIAGNAAGGFFFQTLGAPLMFLFNGISYLFSAALLPFVRIPRIAHRHAPQHFLADLKDGLVLVWRSRGLRYLFLIAAALNFFATVGIVLFLPLFQRTAGLGAGRYGLTMGFLTGGLFLGFLASSAVPIPPVRRFRIFMVCGFVLSACFALLPLAGSFPLMLALALAGGFANAVINSSIPATLQLVVPPDMRGKVFSLIGSLTQGLTPISMALAGVAAEFIPLRPLISASFAITFVLFLPFLFTDSVRRLINFDPSVDAAEAVLV